jgi:hypothetical protein
MVAAHAQRQGAQAAHQQPGVERRQLGAEIGKGGLVEASNEFARARHHAGDDDRLNELHGTVSALDTTAQTFVVRGITAHYSGNTSFLRGGASDLANGKAVEVKGRLASDGVTLEAKQVKFEQ